MNQELDFDAGENRAQDTAYQTIKELDALPSPAGAALSICELANDPSATIEQLLAIVETDPAIAGRALKFVNSPIAGLHRSVTSLRTAVTMLGTRNVKIIALSLTLMSHKTEQCPTFGDGWFWTESLVRAVTARHVAATSKAVPYDEAFACGLLSQIGRLSFATVYPETYDEVLRTAGWKGAEVLAREERDAFDLDHRELGARIVADWHMPPWFSLAIRHQDNADNLPEDLDSKAAGAAHALNLAGVVAQIVQPRTLTKDSLSRYSVVANQNGISPQTAENTFNDMRNEWNQMADTFAIQPPRVDEFADLYRFV